ncbi:PTS system mannitol-specific IIC component [Microbacterium resistens]|uniref:PTS system mannitol-specific EIICB component n=1 Tax=Microbacterium resistens TaxID=156977 RepID=A0ABU1S9I9_9MICO|nr:PTS mannitol transporter subunit IICB [Microbacterium resistens]MDR6866275.1 PTS system mannitol-specific IIC component [Microbacterium resistens]
MTTTSAPAAQPGSVRVAIQRFGTFLSGMIMPNIPALIAWGIFTAFFIDVGWTPNPGLSSLVGPMIHYLLPLLIAYTGGSMVYRVRGGVVAAIATFGVIAGSDLLIANFNAELLAADPEAKPLGQVHMFIGAMIIAPIAAYTMKWLDRLWEGRVRAGFEMLVNMFSAGIWGFAMAILGFYPVAWLVNGLMSVLSSAVNWLVENNLLPLTSILIEPAKVFFLNNAINHGVLTPLGTQQATESGKSILFLLEANPGPGLGLLLAFTLLGVGAARATAPGAAIIQFFGGIHEVYFPYALMKPTLILALIAGGMTGVTTNMLLGGALRAPAAPGSIIAVLAQTANGAYFAVILSVVLSAAVTFLVAAVILRASRKRDLAAEALSGDAFAEAIRRTETNKGKSSSALSDLAASAGTDDATAPAGAAAGAAGAAPAAAAAGLVAEAPISHIVFACDAGMGSSAMGASVLRNKFKKAGIEGVTVINQAIANLDGTADLVITQQQLTDRARAQSPDSLHVSVDNFMNSPKYEEVVELVRRQHDSQA